MFKKIFEFFNLMNKQENTILDKEVLKRLKNIEKNKHEIK